MTPRWVTWCVAALLVAGIGLRFWQLDRMFAQHDDLFPIAGPYVMNQGEPKVVAVPYTGGRLTVTADTQTIKRNPIVYAAYVSTATYAPLQFALFPLVLSGDYPYREFLFRGRLPSAVFGALALVAFLWAYRAFAPAIDAPALVGLGAMAFSLLSITYAQQSISYAIGVLGAAVLLGMLGRMASAPSTLRRLVWWGAGCALLAYANYQLAVLAAAAYAALALTELRRGGASAAGSVVLRFAASGAVCAALVLPLAIPLHDKTSGVGQFAGLAGADQFFPPTAADGLAGAATYAGTAAFRLVETVTLFALDSTAARAGVLVLGAFALAGLLAAWRRSDGPGRALAAFAAAVLALLAILNGAGQFPISPTRHLLVFLPLLALLMSLGAARLRPGIVRDAGLAGLVLAMAAVFAWHYPAFRSARTDRFDEQAMAALLDRYGVETVVAYGSTWHPALMFRTDPGRRFRFIDLDAIVRKGQSLDQRLPRQPHLLVSQTLPLDQYSASYPHDGPRLELAGYHIQELVRTDADVEIGISNAVKLGGNGLFISLAIPAGAGADGEGL